MKMREESRRMSSRSGDVVRFLDGARAGEAVALDGAVKCLPALSASVRPASGVRFLDGDRASALPQVHNEKLAAPKSPAAGKQGAAEGKVLAFADDSWHATVKAVIDDLEDKNKFKAAELDPGALNAIRTLPAEAAVALLNKVRDEKIAIRNMNAYVVKNTSILRNHGGIDEAASSSSSCFASGGSPRCRERLQDVAPTTLGVFPSRTRSPGDAGPDDGAVDKTGEGTVVTGSLADSRIGCRTDAQPPSPVVALAPPAARDISGASEPVSEPPGARAVAGASPPAALSEREKAVAREVGVWGP